MDTNINQVLLVQDINPNVVDGYGGSTFPESSFPRNLFEFGDRLYFAADNDENGVELFVSDGTREGTQLLADINPSFSSGSYRPYLEPMGEDSEMVVNSFPNSSNPSNFVEFSDRLYFAADNGENGNELYVTDGTAEGTQLVVDLRPGESNYGYTYGSNPNNLVEFNDRLYFSANNGEIGNELYVTDGTAEGTQLVVDLRPGENNYGYIYGSNPNNLVEFNDRLYFSANNGESGNELYVTDGTAEGTQLVADINPNVNFGYNGTAYPRGSYLGDLTEFNGKLYFTADNGESGRELFVSDGTVEGTQLLTDLRPGSSNYGYNYGSNPYNLTEFNGKLYFTANDGTSGNEIFVTDGTAEGTQLVADINPGESNFGSSYGSYASGLTVVGDELFFAANDGEVGTELFKLIEVDATPVTITGSDLPEELFGSDRFENIQALGGNDTVNSGAGNDTVDGGEGDDIIIGSSGDNSLAGGAGNDVVEGGDGADTLLGDSGADLLTGLSGNDNLAGGSGNDTLNGDNGADLLNGDDGDDVLNSGNGNDNLAGGEGNDTLDGGNGRDILFGDNGSDILIAGEGDDYLAGGESNDTLNGGSGNDTLSGGNGDDRLVAGDGNDLLLGGNGNDFLDGGSGIDLLEGGSGDDLFMLRNDGGRDTIIDFDLGGDRLGLADGLHFNDLSFAGSDILFGREVLVSLNGINTEQLTESDFNSI